METLQHTGCGGWGPCLNRTMQYGNGIALKKIDNMMEKFKSYYVVWKPIGIYLFSQGKAMFKSYYVVWKRTSPAFHAATLRAV